MVTPNLESNLIVSPEEFAEIGREVFATREPGYKNKKHENVEKEICSSLIGTTFEVCTELWALLDPMNNISKDAKPKHLLWALLLLRNYSTEFINARLVGGVDPGTFRKWSWVFVDAISGLKDEVIIFDRRFIGWDGKTVCLLSVDCVDTPIKESWPFDPEIFSQKLNGAGFKYEIATSIQNCDIVWVNGPFKAGRHDVTIFKNDGLADALCDEECVEADGIYKGHDKLKGPDVGQTAEDRSKKGKVRGRHEIVNGRLKKFRVLDDVFRHKREKHQNCFFAVAVIVQLQFELHGHLYDVDYSVEY